MRPYTTSHATAQTILQYLSKGGQLLSGSLPVATLKQAKAAFRLFEEPHGEGLLHITMSLPQGHVLTDDVWCEVTQVVLNKMGIPPVLTPWIMWGRESTACDHIHIVSGRQTFCGRPLEVCTSTLNTDRIDRHLRGWLSLPELPWRYDPRLILCPDISARVIKANPEVAQFASDLNAVMKADRPTNLAEVNKAMFGRDSSFWITPTPDRPGMLTPVNLITDESFNPKTAGSAFSSKFILARFRLAARLRILALSIFLHKVARLSRNLLPSPKLCERIHYDDTFIGPRTDASQARSGEGRRADSTRPAFASRARTRRRGAGVRRQTDRAFDSNTRPVRTPGNDLEPAHAASRHIGPEIAENRRRTVLSRRRAYSRGHRVKAVYAAAEEARFPITHRFVANGSAIILRGTAGAVAILDLQNGGFMPSGEDDLGMWGDYFAALQRFTDCHLPQTGPEVGNGPQ